MENKPKHLFYTSNSWDVQRRELDQQTANTHRGGEEGGVGGGVRGEDPREACVPVTLLILIYNDKKKKMCPLKVLCESRRSSCFR